MLTNEARAVLAILCGLRRTLEDGIAELENLDRETPVINQEDKTRQENQAQTNTPMMTREHYSRIANKCRALGVVIPNMDLWTEEQAKAQMRALKRLEAEEEQIKAQTTEAIKEGLKPK